LRNVKSNASKLEDLFSIVIRILYNNNISNDYQSHKNNINEYAHKNPEPINNIPSINNSKIDNEENSANIKKKRGRKSKNQEKDEDDNKYDHNNLNTFNKSEINLKDANKAVAELNNINNN
jgi:hypothetical protein